MFNDSLWEQTVEKGEEGEKKRWTWYYGEGVEDAAEEIGFLIRSWEMEILGNIKSGF